MLDSSAGIRYNVYRKGTATSGWPQFKVYSF
jgi:hypothetical protein